MTFEYSDKVMAHFLDPKNVGMIANADGIGRLGDIACDDIFEMHIRVENSRLVEIKYLVQGCGAAIATCSALSVLATGLTIAEALKLTDNDIANELGGLPLEKLHCSNLAATVLHKAIADYQRQQRPNKAHRPNGEEWRTWYGSNPSTNEGDN